MEEILKYENREKLYKFLIDNLDFKIIEEKYDHKHFGNFYIILESKNFLLSYVNDRSFLDINIISKLDQNNGFSLSFVRDFIYTPQKINTYIAKDNATRIKELNDFLKKDFSKVSELFSKENYWKTKKQIDDLLKKQFYKKFPNAK